MIEPLKMKVHFVSIVNDFPFFYVFLHYFILSISLSHYKNSLIQIQIQIFNQNHLRYIELDFFGFRFS